MTVSVEAVPAPAEEEAAAKAAAEAVEAVVEVVPLVEVAPKPAAPEAAAPEAPVPEAPAPVEATAVRGGGSRRPRRRRIGENSPQKMLRWGSRPRPRLGTGPEIFLSDSQNRSI